MALGKQGGESKPLGSVKLRQAYVREGYNYLCVTVPLALANAMSWVPGDELMFYPFQDEAGMVGVKLVNQRDLMRSHISDFAEAVVPTVVEKWRGPKPGSFADIERQRHDEVQGILDHHDKVDAEKKAARLAARELAEKKLKLREKEERRRKAREPRLQAKEEQLSSRRQVLSRVVRRRSR